MGGQFRLDVRSVKNIMQVQRARMLQYQLQRPRRMMGLSMPAGGLVVSAWNILDFWKTINFLFGSKKFRVTYPCNSNVQSGVLTEYTRFSCLYQFNWCECDMQSNCLYGILCHAIYWFDMSMQIDSMHERQNWEKCDELVGIYPISILISPRNLSSVSNCLHA